MGQADDPHLRGRPPVELIAILQSLGLVQHPLCIRNQADASEPL